MTEGNALLTPNIDGRFPILTKVDQTTVAIVLYVGKNNLFIHLNSQNNYHLDQLINILNANIDVIPSDATALIMVDKSQLGHIQPITQILDQITMWLELKPANYPKKATEDKYLYTGGLLYRVPSKPTTDKMIRLPKHIARKRNKK